MEKDFLIELLIKFKHLIFPRAHLEKAKQELKLGHREDAICLLKRALKVDPGNEEARKILKDMN